MNYDLEDRTIQFSKSIIKFIKEINKEKLDIHLSSLLNQLIRSATSVGANYMEANGSCSKKDFRNKIVIARKEAKESLYWINLIGVYREDKKDGLIKLYKENKELINIFSKIYISCK